MLAKDKNRKLKVSFGGFSSAGVKLENQDAFSALQPEGRTRDLKGIVACVADGVSCSENAQKASQMMVSQFIDDYYATPDTWQVKTAVSKILSSLNNWLFHHGQQAFSRQNGFVTTFTSLIIKSNTAHIFHVGDSRIYRYRKSAGRLQLLTRDHVQKQGEQTILTRALGMDNHLEIDYKQESCEASDIYIITTDGVHDFVSPAEIRQAIERGETLEQTAHTIVEHALASGSQDNLTSLLVRVDQLPVATVNEVHRELTQLTIPPVMEPGMSIDGYHIKQVIHSGTRSHLYLVQHPDHQKCYVLKAPSESFSEDAQYLEGFIREQWVGLRIDNDNVMKVYPPSPESAFLYLLMEYIEGKTLRQWMHDNAQASLEQMRNITEGIIKGLRVFNRLEMIHRDLKPENIMISEDGRVKIIDFGTVKVSGLAEIYSPLNEDIPVGSVDYIAPEYLLYNKGNLSSDLFSLGVIIYEMLSGKLPYNMSHAHRRLPKRLSEWQYQSILEHRSDIPVWIDSTLKKAIAPQMALRHEALSELMADLCQPSQEFISSEKITPFIDRNPLLFWQSISLLLLLIIIAQWALL